MIARWFVGIIRYLGAVAVFIATMAAYMWTVFVPDIVRYLGYEWPWGVNG